MGEEVSQAFDLRDRGFAEAPYVAEWLWLERIAPGGLEAAISRGLIKTRWNDLKNEVAGLHQLSAELDQSIVKNGQDDGWKKPRDTVAKVQADMATTLAAYYQNLLSQAGHQERVVGAERLLALPTLTAEERQKLRQRQHATLDDNLKDTETQVANRHAYELDDSASPGQATSTSPEAISTSDVSGHPILTLLSPFAPADEKLPQPRPDAENTSRREIVGLLAAQGGIIRNRLKRADQVLKVPAAPVQSLTAQASAAAASEPGDRRAGEIRAPWSQADRALRSVVGLYRPDDKLNPSVHLYGFDLQQLMLLDCQRAMEDFWGPSDAPYFRTVAEDCLAKAELLDDSDQSEPLRAPCRRRLASLVSAAARPLQVGTVSPVEIGRDNQWTQLLLHADLAAGVPEGIAAAYLQQEAVESGRQIVPLKRDSGKPESFKRIGFDVADASQASAVDLPPVYVMSAADWLSPGPAPKSVAFYRGHEYLQPLAVVERGVPIEYTPDVPVFEPTVVVRGKGTLPISVMFIFDCSGSMGLNKDVLMNGVQQARFEAGKSVLLTILQRLEGLQRLHGYNFQVGLCLYGHRENFAVNENNHLIPAPAEPTKYKTIQSPFAIKSKEQRIWFPGMDEKIVLKVGRFTEERLKEATKLLTESDLAAFGATPLYLAIQDVVKHLDDRADRTIQRIVAITDGVNNQDKPERLPQKPVLALDLKRLFAQHKKMRLDIIGIGKEFDIPQDPQDPQRKKDKSDVQDMKDISQMTGGEFFPTSNAAELLAQLEKSLSPPDFEVAAVGTSSQSYRAPLNQTVKVTPAPSAKTHYDVKVLGLEHSPTADVWLEGDEALELTLENGALKFDPYERDEPKPLEVVSVPGDARRDTFRVCSHIPDAPGVAGWARFYVSIQNSVPTVFTQRPAEAWVDVTPLADDNAAAQTYHFCDMNFKSQRPVPVLACQVPEFPPTCRKAAIELWFKMQPTTAETKRVGELVEGDGIESAGARLRATIVKDIARDNANATGLDGVVVKETPVDPAADTYRPGRIKVEAFSQDGAGAIKVIHDYSAGEHRFVFPRGTALQNCVVKVTPRDALEEGAFHYKLGEQVLPRN